jgi:hypothetical protein
MKQIFMTGACIMLLAACSTISKFDQYAYTQATSLKVDALNVMELATDSFPLHRTEVARVGTDISKMLEYQRNRPKNAVSEKMWTMLQDSTGHLFGGFVARWQKEGRLDTAFVKESQQLIGSSFDQISQLESGKIRSTTVNN